MKMSSTSTSILLLMVQTVSVLAGLYVPDKYDPRTMEPGVPEANQNKGAPFSRGTQCYVLH